MHKTLESQLKQYLATTNVSAEMQAFIQAVDATYKQLEQAAGHEDGTDQTPHVNKEAARLHASINSLHIGLIMTDVTGKILTLNKAAKDILWLRGEVQGTTITNATLAAETPNISIADLQPFFVGIVDLASQVSYCIKERRAIDFGALNYGKRILNIVLQPILSGEVDIETEREIIGTVVILQDVTDQKLMERSKDEFFSIASHELRTPLTAIRGNTSLIQQYYRDKLQDEDLKDMIGDIHDSSIRLINIVNDFLNTSRLEMGRMQFKKDKFDLKTLADDVLKEYITTGSMKKILMQINPPSQPLPHVVGDIDRVKQVLINLIGNAMKFTEAGTITVSFEVKEALVITKVSDTGKGIPTENQALLFRKFQQAAASLYTRDDVQGTGLGLYISKMMMEGMGGSIWLVSSELGRGTTFAFSLSSAT